MAGEILNQKSRKNTFRASERNSIDFAMPLAVTFSISQCATPLRVSMRCDTSGWIATLEIRAHVLFSRKVSTYPNRSERPVALFLFALSKESLSSQIHRHFSPQKSAASTLDFP